MLWGWLVMTQGVKNTPATFIGMMTQLFRPLRDFALYWNGIREIVDAVQTLHWRPDDRQQEGVL